MASPAYTLDQRKSREHPDQQQSLENGQPAEWLPLPQDRIVTVEHPCIVKNIDNALHSLGGENHIKNVGLLPSDLSLLDV